MKLTLTSFTLPLKHAFTISRRSFDQQDTLIVTLEKDGIKGFGEATSNPYYPNTEIETMTQQLEELRDLIEKYNGMNPAEFWEKMNPFFEKHPFAQCALDVAAWDWYGKKNNQALYECWNLNPGNIPPTSYTLSIDSPGKMIERMRQNPWPVYKIKLGKDNDIELVTALRQHTKSKFWVDINAAWSVNEAIEKSFLLKALGVEFIEQPLPADDWTGMEKLYQASALPLIADESCRTYDDIARCADCFHGVNIKIMKAGGLTPTLKMIQKAKSLNLKTMVGCMTESTVGISAIAHLLPLLDYADMDGALFLKKDIARGVEITANEVKYADEKGSGAILKS